MCRLLHQHSANLTLHYTIRTFNDLENESLENIVEKGENANNQHFSPFPTFSTFSKTKFKFPVIFVMSSANVFNSDKSKILSFGEGLKRRLFFTY